MQRLVSKQEREMQMTNKLSKDTLFKPTRSTAKTKADITDQTARAILDEEAARRQAKTAKLRAAREKKEALEA
ncbi:hypothetical protein [Hoeflea sp.]|uniref:hypothetical protein n=1 Tax=Hoeflea sp. TaxID=1940281 RepID=UPI003B02A64F